MIEHISNIFKRVFNSEETIIFSLIIVFSLLVLGFFIQVLTPFIKLFLKQEEDQENIKELEENILEQICQISWEVMTLNMI